MSYTALSINTFGIQKVKNYNARENQPTSGPLPFRAVQANIDPSQKDNYLYIRIEHDPSANINANIKAVEIAAVNKPGPVVEYQSSTLERGQRIFYFILKLNSTLVSNDVFDVSYRLTYTLNTDVKRFEMIRSVVTPYFMVYYEGSLRDIEGNSLNIPYAPEELFLNPKFSSFDVSIDNYGTDTDNGGLNVYAAAVANANSSYKITSKAQVNFLPMLSYGGVVAVTDIYAISDPSGYVLSPNKDEGGSINFASASSPSFAAYSTDAVQKFYNSGDVGNFVLSGKDKTHILTHVRHDIGTRPQGSRAPVAGRSGEIDITDYTLDTTGGNAGDLVGLGGYYSPPYHTFGSSEHQVLMFWNEIVYGGGNVTGSGGTSGTELNDCCHDSGLNAHKICIDELASNYFGNKTDAGYHYLTGGGTLSANQAYTDSFQVTDAIYNSWIDEGCCSGWLFTAHEDNCEYFGDSSGGNFESDFQIEDTPSGGSCNGSLVLTATGGVFPYTFTLTCAASDAGCLAQANGNTLSQEWTLVDGIPTRAASVDGVNDFTNMTASNIHEFTFGNMCGFSAENPDEFYVLTISHAGTQGSNVHIISGGFIDSSIDAVYNCQNSAALNYINSGTSESTLCRFCDLSTGELNSGTAGNLSDISARIGRQFTGDAPTAFYANDYTVFDCTNTTGDNTYICGNDGLGKVVWYFESALIQVPEFNDYTFNIINQSVEIQESEAEQSFILKYRRFSFEDYEKYYLNLQSGTEVIVTPYDARSNLFNNGTPLELSTGDSSANLSDSNKLRTLTLATAAATFTASGVSSPGEQWGVYVGLLSVTDSNSVHEIEKCTYYTEPKLIKVPGCTDAQGSNWIYSDFAISNYPANFHANFVIQNYELNQIKCQFIDFDQFALNISNFMEFRVFYASSQSGVDCSFDIKLQWKLTQAVDIGGLGAYVPGAIYESGDDGWNTFGIANNAFFSLIRGIASTELNFEYIHPDLNIVNNDTAVLIKYQTAPASDSLTPYTPIEGELKVEYGNGLFLFVDPTTGGVDNIGNAPIQVVTLGTSPETGQAAVGCVSAIMDIAIEYGENSSQLFSIPFLDAPGALVTGQEFLGAGQNSFPLLSGTPLPGPASVDGLCVECTDLSGTSILGCTDELACNYDANANVDDGSCSTNPAVLASDYQVAGLSGELSVLTGTYTGSSFNPCAACTDEAAANTDGAYDDYLNKYASINDKDINGAILALTCTNVTIPGVCPPGGPTYDITQLCYYETPGCTDPNATNYDITATIDDGSCNHTVDIPGCTDVAACNYNGYADLDDGSCYYTPSEDLNCPAFNNWELINIQQPSVCNGTISDGSFVLRNATYNENLYFKIEGNPYFEISDENNSYYYLAGAGNTIPSNPYSPYSTATEPWYNIGSGTSFIKPGPTAITVVQDPTAGTTITVSGITEGVYKISLVQANTDARMLFGSLPCYCTATLGEIGADTNTFNSGANTSGNIYDITQGVYVTPEGAWQTTEGSFATNVPYFNLHVNALSGTNRFTGERTNVNCGCCDPDASNYNEDIAINNPYSCTPATCEFYGCMDQLAANYWPKANISCTDPENQYDCEPCIYANISVNSLYSPSFCMPKQLDAQIAIIKKCIATSGTNAYVNMITGQTECAYNDAWRLILIEYLLSRKGLDCLYNCKDAATPNLETQPSCEQRSSMATLVGSLGHSMEVGERRTFQVGMTLSYRPVEEVDNRYYVLNYLPGNVGSITIKHPSEYGDDDTVAESAQHQTLTPDKWLGWYVCEEGPSKPTNLNYIDKFVNFVQNYCRNCTVQQDIEEIQTIDVPGVITINGMVITINNEDFQ